MDLLVLHQLTSEQRDQPLNELQPHYLEHSNQLLSLHSLSSNQTVDGIGCGTLALTNQPPYKNESSVSRELPMMEVAGVQTQSYPTL